MQYEVIQGDSKMKVCCERTVETWNNDSDK